MNKKLLLVLLIFLLVVYVYLEDEEEDDEDKDKEPSLKDKIFDFLKMLGIMLGTDLVFKGIAKGIKSAIASRTASNLAKKEAEKFAQSEADRLALLEEERLARQEAERLARAEAERLAQAEAERLAQKEAEKLAQTEAEKLAMTEAERLAEIEAEKIAQKEAEKAIADALAKAEAQKLAQEEADKLAKTEAERLAQEEAERITKAEADRLAKMEAQKILDSTAQKELLKLSEAELAKKGLAKVGETIVLKGAEKTAGRLAGMMAKLMAGPFEWISFALSTAIYASLGLDSSMFDECPDDEWSFTHLPSEVLMVLNAIPFFGDAWQLIGELVCFKVGKCPAGKQLSGAVCYDPCKENYKDDGATMCYKQYGDAWEKRGFPSAPTLTSVTKDVRPILGHAPDSCPPGQEFQAGLCRVPCKAGYDAVLDRCWAHIDTVGNGVGHIPGKKPCSDFQREEGWDNSRDDGTSCWEDLRTWTTGDWRKPVWESGHQEFHSAGCGCIKKTAMQRYQCPPGQSLQPGGALCVEDCPPGMEHPPGLPNQCRTIGEVSYERGIGDLPICGAGATYKDGLCYYLTPGFQIQSAGLESDPCPPGSFDFGAGCTRESYTRGAGHLAFDMHMKKRNNYYGHPDAGDGYIPDIGGMIDRAP